MRACDLSQIRASNGLCNLDSGRELHHETHRQHHPHHRRRLRHRSRPSRSPASRREPSHHLRSSQAVSRRHHQRQSRHAVRHLRRGQPRQHPHLRRTTHQGFPRAKRPNQQRRHHAPGKFPGPTTRLGGRRGHHHHQSPRPIRLTAALLPHLRKQPSSVIMTVSSGLAFVPLSPTPTYCATKAAIHSYTQSLRYQLKDTTTEVLELIPPYVQTDLLDGADDPRAMPLKDYITEVISILKTQPTPTEICVEKVKPLRFAAESGHYDAVFNGLNQAMAARFAASAS